MSLVVGFFCLFGSFIFVGDDVTGLVILVRLIYLPSIIKIANQKTSNTISYNNLKVIITSNIWPLARHLTLKTQLRHDYQEGQLLWPVCKSLKYKLRKC